MDKIQKIKKDHTGKIQEYCNKGDLKELHSLKVYLDDLYYNTDCPGLSDAAYDILKDTLIHRDPLYTPPIGAKIRKHENRVSLPFYLGSTDKITPEEEDVLVRWKDKNPCDSYIISEKLDGVSGLFMYKNGSRKLYTRGDGKVGADISYLIQYFSSIPSCKDFKKDITVRGELIIPKDDFEKYKGVDGKVVKTGTSRTYKNARNMVSGLIGSKTLRKGMLDIQFVVYEIVGDSTMSKPSDQLKTLENMGFTVAQRSTTDNIDMKTLCFVHADFKILSNYEIDGIIVQTDIPYDRNTDGNPGYLFAFKVRSKENIAKTEILDIKWSISKWGQIIPVAVVDPVELAGATLTRFTVHTAENMIKNDIGPGAIVNVTRSKDVIPHIVEVLKPADYMIFPDYEYKWDKNRVHFIVIPTKSVTRLMRIKLFTSFFDKLGIKYLSRETLTKLYDHGFDTLFKIIRIKKGEISTIEGLGEKSADRICKNIQKGFQNVSVSLLLGSAGIFGYGIGSKRVEALLTDIPDLLTSDEKGLKKRVLSVDGFSDINASKIMDNLKYAKAFMMEIRKSSTIKENKRVSNSLVGMKFVMSGFRDKKLEQDITERGGKTTTIVSKKTTGLIVLSKDVKITSKMEKAQKLSVDIYEKDEFISKFI